MLFLNFFFYFQGVSANEMLCAHLLSQFIIMAFQSFEVIMYIGLVFNVTNHGNPGMYLTIDLDFVDFLKYYFTIIAQQL